MRVQTLEGGLQFHELTEKALHERYPESLAVAEELAQGLLELGLVVLAAVVLVCPRVPPAAWVVPHVSAAPHAQSEKFFVISEIIKH